MNPANLPGPGCCRYAAERNGYGVPNIHWWVDPENNARRGWQLSAYSGFIAHCPWCGTKLPQMQLKPKFPSRVCTVTDGGYRCDTCRERLISCSCASPAENFEIKT